MVTILLRMVAPADQEEFVQRIGIFLLNSLSCQVDGKDKLQALHLGGHQALLSARTGPDRPQQLPLPESGLARHAGAQLVALVAAVTVLHMVPPR